MNLEKTEVMWIGGPADGKTITQVDRFVYLLGTECADGGSSKEAQRMLHAYVVAWRWVEGIRNVAAVDIY